LFVTSKKAREKGGKKKKGKRWGGKRVAFVSPYGPDGRRREGGKEKRRDFPKEKKGRGEKKRDLVPPPPPLGSSSLRKKKGERNVLGGGWKKARPFQSSANPYPLLQRTRDYREKGGGRGKPEKGKKKIPPVFKF